MSELNVKGIILPEVSRSANGSYVIENGQLVVDSDTGDLYKGDGTTTFSNLTAIGGKDFTDEIEKINSVNVGEGNSNSGTNAIAIGFDTTADYNYGIAIGNASVSGSQYAVAVGPYAYATGSYSIAIGYHAGATASNTIAIGNGAIASNQYDICLGTQTKGASNKGIYLNEGLVSETIEIPEPMSVSEVDELCLEILGV